MLSKASKQSCIDSWEACVGLHGDLTLAAPASPSFCSIAPKQAANPVTSVAGQLNSGYSQGNCSSVAATSAKFTCFNHVNLSLSHMPHRHRSELRFEVARSSR